MNIKDFFLNSYGRLRSGWRFLIFLFVFIFITLPVTETIQAFLRTLPPAYSQNLLLTFLTPVFIFIIASTFLGWIFGYLLEDLPFRALGWTFSVSWFKELIIGFIIGALSICLAALLGVVFGGLSFQANRTAEASEILNTLGISLIIFVVAAISEETLFRGYLLQTITRAKLAWGGIILTSFLFATAHNANPSASIFSWVNTFLAGIWFAVAYLKTRSLWFPFAIHLAWNWFQGSILGINVSGIKELTPAPLLQAVDTSPTWLTGGSYGIEGGIACTVALLVSTAIIWFLPFLKPTEEMLRLTDEEQPKESKI